jgi:hypothetical protein
MWEEEVFEKGPIVVCEASLEGNYHRLLWRVTRLWHEGVIKYCDTIE